MHRASGRSRILVAVATAKEASALASPLGFSVEDLQPWRLHATPGVCDIALTGVGKANAAGGVAGVLDRDRHAGVLNVGIAGLLPQPGGSIGVASAVLATRSVFADDGILQAGGFRSFSDAGFPLVGTSDAIEPPGPWMGVLREIVDGAGVIATVSTCSGTDAQAMEIRARSGAVAEACEGAACGLSAFRAGLPFAEIRTISNTTGDRASQRWDIAGALARLERLFGKADLAGRLIESVFDAPAG